MKRDLIWGWVFIALTLLAALCIVIHCVNANWDSAFICGFVFGINLMNAIIRFQDYKKRKEYENLYSVMPIHYWSEDIEILSDDDFIDN